MTDAQNLTNFTAGEMITGMCLWEEWLELTRNRPAPMDEIFKQAQQLQEDHGAFAMRSVMLSLVRDCDDAWEVADQMHDQGAFDWEFVPNFVSGALRSGRIEELARGA